jgi:hypothetical protein
MNKYIVGFNENINENEELYQELVECVENNISSSYECLKDFENEHIEFIYKLKKDERRVGELFTIAYKNRNLDFIRYFIDYGYIKFDNKIFLTIFRDMVNYYLEYEWFKELIVIFSNIDFKFHIDKILLNRTQILLNILNSIVNGKKVIKGEEELLQYLIDLNANMIYKYINHSHFFADICRYLKLDLLYIIFDRNNISKSGMKYEKIYSKTIRDMINTFAVIKSDLGDEELVSVISGIMDKFGITKEMIFKNIEYIDELISVIDYLVNRRYFKLFTFYFSENGSDLKYIDIIIDYIDKYYKLYMNDDDKNGDWYLFFNIFRNNIMPDDLYIKLIKKVVNNRGCFILFIDLEFYSSENERLRRIFEEVFGVSDINDIEIIKNMMI